MKSRTIRKIIDTFAKGNFSEVTARLFGQWLAVRDADEQSRDVLMDIWLDCESTPMTDNLLENPYDLIAEISGKAIESKRKSSHVFRRIIIGAAAAAIICVAAISGYVTGRRSGVDVCLASSESSKSYFVLPDSSKVWLNSGSKLYLPHNFSSKSREVVLEGEGYFDVAKNPESPFTVKTVKMDIRVLGTKFTVTAYDNLPYSACLAEGVIEISGKNLPETIMSPGELIVENGNSWLKETVRTSNFTDWTQSFMKFEELSIFDIAKSLEHWYNVRISFRNEEQFGNIKLSFTVNYEPVEEILDAINLISGINYTFDGSDDIVLFLE